MKFIENNEYIYEFFKHFPLKFHSVIVEYVVVIGLNTIEKMRIPSYSEESLVQLKIIAGIFLQLINCFFLKNKSLKNFYKNK